MRTVIGQAIAYLTPVEKARFNLILFLRILVSVFDLIAILAIGFFGISIALFLTSGSDPNRTIEFLSFALPAVTMQRIPFMALLVLALFLTKGLLSIYLTNRQANMLAKVEARSAQQIAAIAFSEGLEDIRRLSKEDIQFAIQVGSPSAFNQLLNFFTTAVAEGALFLFILLAFILVDPLSALMAITYFLCIGFVIHFFIGNRMEKSSEILASSAIAANSGIDDLSEVIREVNVLNRKDHFLNKIYQARIEAASSAASQFTLSGAPRYIIEAALMAGLALFVLIQITVGDLVAAAGSIGVILSGGFRLTAAMLPLQVALVQIKVNIPAAQKALVLLSQGSPKSNGIENGNLKLVQSHGAEVEISEVSFTYANSDEPSIIDLNLKIHAGQQVALIGSSGAGKSTLADLILGLLSPSKGIVLINGVNPSQAIRQNPGLIAYVPQKPGMVSGSIIENIAIGVKPDEVDYKKLEQVIAQAHLKELISDLPHGINTNLGKRKDELSGGQLQRIGLARALYCEPRLLVMDEATSALDATSEHEINKVLDEMRGKITIILIAHRLNTIQRSDIVYLLDRGKITASGSFAELHRSNTTVQNLAALMAINIKD